LIRNPSAIFASKNSEKARILQVESEQEAQFLAIVLETTEKNQEVINILKSAYPKESWIWEEWEKEGLKIEKSYFTSVVFSEAMTTNVNTQIFRFDSSNSAFLFNF